MAKVWKRVLPSGEIRWQANYRDGGGQRRAKMFDRKSEADAWLVQVRHDLVRGLHTPSSVSPTMKEAAGLWIKRCIERRLEPTTIKGYQEHVDLHIVPHIGAKKASEMTVPAVNAFADQLREAGRSAEMIKKVIGSVGSIFKELRRRGLSSTAPTSGLDLDLPDREDPRPEIPSKADLQAIIAGAASRWRPVMLVAIFCGLRASELRGLAWSNVDFAKKQLSLTQRADASHRIGKLKSKAGYRTIPCPPIVINALREWRLLCPKGELDLVFPNGVGKVESHSNMLERGLHPILLAAGITERSEGLDDAGKPVMVEVPKYGLRTLRHACASLWIENGHNPKQIQRLMGHSSIKVTFDVYGHLFADVEADQKAAVALQTKLLGG